MDSPDQTRRKSNSANLAPATVQRALFYDSTCMGMHGANRPASEVTPPPPVR